MCYIENKFFVRYLGDPEMCLSYVIFSVSLLVWGFSIGVLFWRIRILEAKVGKNIVTGLPSVIDPQKFGRRKFLERRFYRGNETAVIFIDMDGFKNLNDTRGHYVGNEVLCIVAEILKRCVRKGDVVAHPHGDEFIVIMFHTDENAVEAFTRRLSQKLLPEICLYDVNYTLGVAIDKKEDLDIKGLVHKADLHMNLQKINKGQR
ncbi:MAG: GGDEF domain-containing protein [Candidatus Moranbacteria bacterium]|nr:GGDEF domain-containing protein [Candidatus Moranbacteria bacterium]